MKISSWCIERAGKDTWTTGFKYSWRKVEAAHKTELDGKERSVVDDPATVSYKAEVK